VILYNTLANLNFVLMHLRRKSYNKIIFLKPKKYDKIEKWQLLF